MQNLSSQIASATGLLQALEGITNRRAFLSLLVSSLVGSLLLFVVMYLAMRLTFSGNGGFASAVGLIGGLLCAVVILSGFSASGIHLIRQFRQQEPMTLSSSFLAALATLPRFIGLFLLLGVVALLVWLAIALIFFICKIPGIGPLLYTVALPVSALVVALLFYASVFVTPLSAPAIWSGKGVFETLAVLWGILRERLLSVVVQSLLLGLLTGLVGGLIMGGVIFGLFASGSISMLIVGDFSGNPMAAMMNLMGGMSGGSGHMLAGGLGALLLLASASVLPLLVLIGGNCIIFDGVTSGLSTDEIAARLREQLANVREQAEAAGKRLGEAGKEIADKARQAQAESTVATPPANAAATPVVAQASAAVAAAAPIVAETPAAPAEAIAPAVPQAVAPAAIDPLPAPAACCPGCQNPVAVDDAFCGNCGTRLG